MKFDKYFTEPEERSLFAYLAQFNCLEMQRDWHWCKLARITALRVDVMAHYTVGEAEQATRTQRFVINPEFNKRGKDGDFYCSKPLCNVLKQSLAIHRKMDNHRLDCIPRIDRPLILSRRGDGLSVRSYQTRIKQHCKAAGIVEGTPHWWRHTWAKRQLAQSNTPATVLNIQEHLGHDDINTTRIYLQPGREEMDDFMRGAA